MAEETRAQGGFVARLQVLRNTPLRPLANKMRTLVEQCDEFLVATAFVSLGAVQDFLVTAAKRRQPSIRFLTGTFGHNTRQATFENLLKLQEKGRLDARVWSCGSHENFHEKLYLWRLPKGLGVAWVGSANFTDGGMQAEGEFVVEIRGKWDGPEILALRRAFDAEWKRGEPINQKFVATYKEAERPAVDLKKPRKRRGAPKRKVLPKNGLCFITSIEDVADDETEERVQRLLGGTADQWMHHGVQTLSKIRVGQRGVLADNTEGTVALVQVTDTARDGGFWVFAFEPVFGSRSWLKWSSALRKQLAAAGLGSDKKSPRSRWISAERATSVARAMYPRRTTDW